jgi:hypothetical protein
MVMKRTLMLFFLMIINETVPMEQYLFHFVPQSHEYIPLTNSVLSTDMLYHFENIVNIGMVISNLRWISSLRKKQYFFDTALICQATREIYYSSVSMGLIVAALLMNRRQHNEDVCLQSDVINKGLFIASVGTNLMHVSNFVHQSALKFFKKNIHIIIKKNSVDRVKFPDPSCLICCDDITTKNYVNPCDQQDHIFCKQCLLESFNQQQSKATFFNKESFFCEFCRKEVLFNNQKFEIEDPSKPKVTLSSWLNQLDICHMMLYILGIYTLGILSFCTNQ